jgi:hypothetical protein
MSESDSFENDEFGIDLRLSSQRALLGNIPASLRSASVEYREKEIACRFIFDGEPSEYDRELLSCAATEIIADYNELFTINEEYLSVRHPSKMRYLQYLVFERHEK